MYKALLIPALGLFSSLSFAHSSLWVDADDLFLRHHIQQLADADVITVPVTTFPLMWDAIDDDLLARQQHATTPALQESYQYVVHYYRKARGKQFKTQLAVDWATRPKDLNGFGINYREKAKLTLSSEHVGSFWAARLSTQIRSHAEDNIANTFDNSYIATIAGNWMIRAGAIDQWWGPGWDSSLIMSSNSRPLPAISVTRSNNQAFETPLLSWMGSWSFTTQMAQLEKERHVANAKLWSARGTLKPLSGLEIGASWSIQWGGEDQPSTMSDFIKAITSQAICANGEASCDSKYHTKLGNHLAGIDLRYNFSLGQYPVAIYAQTIGEDSVNYIKPADKSYIYGLETTVVNNGNAVKVFAEYLDTLVACGTDLSVFNCYYNHGTYQTGYRHHGRSIGASYDNDAKIYTLGLMGTNQERHNYAAKLRIGTLNWDNAGARNTVSTTAKDIMELELNYQRPLFGGMTSLYGTYRHSKQEDKSTDNRMSVGLKWDYRY